MNIINFDHMSSNPFLPEVKEAMIEAIRRIMPILRASTKSVIRPLRPWKSRVIPWPA